MPEPFSLPPANPGKPAAKDAVADGGYVEGPVWPRPNPATLACLRLPPSPAAGPTGVAVCVTLQRAFQGPLPEVGWAILRGLLLRVVAGAADVDAEAQARANRLLSSSEPMFALAAAATLPAFTRQPLEGGAVVRALNAGLERIRRLAPQTFVCFRETLSMASRREPWWELHSAVLDGLLEGYGQRTPQAQAFCLQVAAFGADPPGSATPFSQSAVRLLGALNVALPEARAEAFPSPEAARPLAERLELLRCWAGAPKVLRPVLAGRHLRPFCTPNDLQEVAALMDDRADVSALWPEVRTAHAYARFDLALRCAPLGGLRDVYTLVTDCMAEAFFE